MIRDRQELEERLKSNLARALSKDGPAYEAFLSDVAGLLRGWLLGRGHDRDEVEDLIQDVLVSVHRKKHLYDPARPFLPWLFAVARYRLIDAARARARRPATVALDELLDLAAPEERSFEQALLVEELLEPLSDRQRRVLVLAKLEGMSLDQVGEKLGISTAAAKVAVRRAVKKLKGLFSS